MTESAELVRPQAEAKHLEMDVHLKGLKMRKWWEIPCVSARYILIS